MKTLELKSMTTDELKNKLSGLKQELFNLRFSHATGQLANPMLLNTTKKDIAKIKTILRERELNLGSDGANA
jgi:large subunit ribosomal protein L29